MKEMISNEKVVHDLQDLVQQVHQQSNQVSKEKKEQWEKKENLFLEKEKELKRVFFLKKSSKDTRGMDSFKTIA